MAKSFFERVMKTDPLERYTADEAMKHPFITGAKDQEVPISAYEMMLYFNLEQNFGRVIIL
jgi:serine/threonine protein kinase